MPGAEVTISVQVGKRPVHMETIPFPIGRGFLYKVDGSSIYIAKFGDDHVLQADVVLHPTAITCLLVGTKHCFVLTLMPGSKAILQIFSTPEETVPVFERTS